ncbi:sulfite exporter TauE/SafE family protein [Nocardia sp. NPDC058058]|uniref:sulfite exporter TauE/SafE family protein n=1 Tax=Nocardia sp. NPDC058058 TaxID=3346317 RepID=UPI0036DA502C
MSTILILLLAGCVTGATTVLFGFGGGFVTVPVVYAVSAATSTAAAMHVAVATSTAVMIVNAAIATLAHARSGLLRREYLCPLAGFIAVGAVLGVLAAGLVPDRTLRLLFVAYLVVAIADISLRRGFLIREARTDIHPAPFGRAASVFGGIGIGAVAAFLGVGGSVLTVPLLRRRGLAMAEATALANPLSVPVAVVGTALYSLAAPGGSRAGLFGQVDVVAAVTLLAGSLPAIAATKRSLVKIPDRAHAIGYPLLLTVVLIAMSATVIG